MRFRGILRPATAGHVPAITALIARSVHGLQSRDYTLEQWEGALGEVFAVDHGLIADGSYFVIEAPDGRLAGAGGWSSRTTLYGGGHVAGDDDGRVDPEREPARMRAYFVDPDFARRGVASTILEACENAARAAGFRCAVLGATLTGTAFYSSKGYIEIGREEVPLTAGLMLTVVHMTRCLV